MSKKNEDSVERFFRKAANQYDSRFRESDWEKMEKMLDEQASANTLLKYNRLKQTALSLIGFSIVLLTVYFLAFDQDRPKVGQDGLIRKMQAAADEESPLQNGVKTENSAADLPSSSPKIKTTKVPSVAAFEPEENETSTKDKKAKVAPAIHGTGISDGVRIHKEKKSAPSGDHQVSPEKPVQQETVAVISQKQGQVTLTVPSEDSVEKDPELQTEEATLPEVKDEVQPEALVEEKKIQSSPYRWSIAVVVAPDFSSTALGNYSSPGGAFGLMVGYRIANRFSVNTGLLRSAKKYEGYGNEYRPPEGYWKNKTNGIVPDEIKGACSIIEIPLIFQYDIKQNSRSRVYIAGGAASYFMLDESYRYTFDSPNPGAAEGWSSTKSRSYPLGIGHLSLGYERQFTPHLSIGIEPFLKVPFASIGWSNIELFSTGAYVNVRYRLLKRNM